MWTVPRRESSEERCDRLLALYDQQIADLEATRPSPYWDGYCGLVRVCDEDLIRPDSAQNTALAARLAAQQQEEQQQGGQRRHRQPSQGQQQWGDDGGTAAAGRLAGGRLASAAQGTPVSGSPRGSLSGSSPFKPGPGTTPHGKQSAAVLAEQAALLLQQQGRLREAGALLHAALRACPTTDTQLAGRCIDLLLEAEREAQETPSHSRAGSDVERLEDQLALSGPGPASGGGGGGAGAGPARGSGGGGSGGAAAVGEVAQLLRSAVQALAAGEERRAVGALQRAAAACPPELVELRRRVELYLELVQCKKRL